MQKLDRYHIDVYTPEWSRDSILDFCMSLKGVPLKYSKHALKKIYKLTPKIRWKTYRLIRSFNPSDEVNLDYVFEFYAIEKSIRKVCFRIPIIDTDIDIIIVVANTGKIVTIYAGHNKDFHKTLRSEIYTKE